MVERVKRLAGRVARGAYRRLRPSPAPTPAAVVEPPTADDVSVIFDAGYYLDTNPDLAEAGIDARAHYDQHGRAEGRAPSPLFDPAWYAENHPEIAATGLDPLEHFLTVGGQEGLDPVRAGFDSAWYLAQHPDVAASGENPLVHYLRVGAASSADPSEHFDTAWYLAHNPDVAGTGMNPLVHYLWHGIGERRRPNDRGVNLLGEPGDDSTRSVSVAHYLGRSHPDLHPLRVVPGPTVPRINLVTDSIGENSLFGGVATALLLAAAWVERSGRRLRIVTRTSAPDASGLGDLFRTIGLRTTHQPELAYVPRERGDYLETGEDEVFLTTSWWSTASVLKTVPAERVAYILQEDERCFYPIGHDWLMASRIMNHPGLRVVVNTENLRQHLISTGVDNLARTAVSFEPSFRAFLRPGRLLGADRKRHLFFYARPHNPRNLFHIGIAALDRAIADGHLPREQWQVHLVGREVPALEFSDGSRPAVHGSLGWADYGEFLGTMDIGLSLMASPHPSYPPLDLAASGSVVVTNEWAGKMSFDDVSDRIVVAEPEVAALADAIGRAARRVEELTDQPFAPADTPYFAPWPENLAPAVDHLAEAFGDA
ncbi:hypothetical protein [Cellulomonas sp. NPDC089187]|uniref:rhamnosyltransferase WsaF family glycosyltransferase n=1 Tax=Cellulomonas sp. NPDC089187 TaxID=3154970 RepID=UPI00342549AF